MLYIFHVRDVGVRVRVRVRVCVLYWYHLVLSFVQGTGLKKD